jgi:uncharacterized integral membrane protein
VANVQYIYWLITFLLLVVFVAFTAANLELVTVDFWPFEYQLSLPFALVVLGSLLTGFMVGAFLMWLRFGAARARARRAEQRASLLERELVDLRRAATVVRGPSAGSGAPQLAAPASGFKTAAGGN